MIKTTIVAFLALICSVIHAAPLSPEINQIEFQWAKIYYEQTNSEQKKNYPILLKHILKLQTTHPNSSELKIWRAIILSTNAEYESPLTALKSINTAKLILESSIKTNPLALDGAAYVVLGTLYYMTPGWPISFGDEHKADLFLKKGIEINPKSIDANYFYADYLQSIDKIDKATKYLKLALKSPLRREQKFADTQLKKEAMIALNESKQRKLETGKNNFFSLFSSASNE